MRCAKIDNAGMFVTDVICDEPTNGMIADPCPSGFYWPKWDGIAWVEGRTQAEIDAIKASAPIPQATPEQRLDTIEPKVVSLEQTIEVIFGWRRNDWNKLRH